MQGHGAVSKKCLNLGDEEITLLEESAHLQFVAFKFSALYSKRRISNMISTTLGGPVSPGQGKR